MLLRYLQFLRRSANEHSLHSPFVFDLYTHVIRAGKPYYIFNEIEQIRRELLRSQEKIQTQDFGAGGNGQMVRERMVKDIARQALKPAWWGQLLFRLVNHFQPQVVIDLGTSLGVTTAYLAAPCPKAQVYTFEGCPHTLGIAQRNFNQLGFTHVQTVCGNIDQTLPAQLATLSAVDFVFFDANHRLAPTLAYVEYCLSKAHEDSVFVLDDIYWSAEMTEAWRHIKTHPAVTLTIDLFRLGLVFFRRKQPRQHFVLRF